MRQIEHSSSRPFHVGTGIDVKVDRCFVHEGLVTLEQCYSLKTQYTVRRPSRRYMVDFNNEAYETYRIRSMADDQWRRKYAPSSFASLFTSTDPRARCLWEGKFAKSCMPIGYRSSSEAVKKWKLHTTESQGVEFRWIYEKYAPKRNSFEYVRFRMKNHRSRRQRHV